VLLGRLTAWPQVLTSPDGLMSADVGVTEHPDGRPCSIAVEYDGSLTL
jgi:hypothetical protein